MSKNIYVDYLICHFRAKLGNLPTFCEIFICFADCVYFAYLKTSFFFRLNPAIVTCCGSAGATAARNASPFPVAELVEVYRPSAVTAVWEAYRWLEVSKHRYREDGNTKDFAESTAKSFCGESEIRTREPLLEATRFPGVPLQPLEHLSNYPCCL